MCAQALMMAGQGGQLAAMSLHDTVARVPRWAPLRAHRRAHDLTNSQVATLNEDGRRGFSAAERRRSPDPCVS